MKKKVLLIYTGGTIGMIKDKVQKTLIPFNFDTLLEAIPELHNEQVILDNISTKNPIDSSNTNTSNWIEITDIIKSHYNTYNSFVILHGTDTMAYTASALSFMLENLSKAIILTGSQIPIGERRTDAKENLITSIEIALSGKINEVCIYFEDQLYRGNRTVKVNTEDFEAFKSPNYPILAEAGVNIKYHSKLLKPKKKNLIVHQHLSNDVNILKLFPGIKISTIENILKNSKGIVIESFGAGNTPNSTELMNVFNTASKEGKIILNVTQCLYGSAIEGRYQTNESLKKVGVICGKDMTTESAITKLMFLLAKGLSDSEIKIQLQTNLRGEISN